MKLGENIYALRTERNMGQKELALLLNLSVGTISNYEKSVHFPDLFTIRKVADIFDVTVDYLLGRTGYRCSPEALTEYITTEYTVSDFINTLISLDTASRTSITDFADYLKNKRGMGASPRPSEKTRG